MRIFPSFYLKEMGAKYIFHFKGFQVDRKTNNKFERGKKTPNTNQKALYTENSLENNMQTY